MEEPIYTVTLYLTREGAERYLEDGYTIRVSTTRGAAFVCPAEQAGEFEVKPEGCDDVSIPSSFSFLALDFAEDIAFNGCE